MKKIFVLVLLLAAGLAHAQYGQRHKIAIFTPLYLDSAFDAVGNFRYEKTGARFATSGLDFYYGAQMALDSLERRGAQLEVFVYDTRGHESISQQLARPELSDVDLLIAQSNVPETKLLAEAAQRKKIPFISATLPNDAGIVNNPYVVVLNTTLQAHVEGIYRFLQKYHSLDRIVVFRKNGQQEDLIKNHFIEYGHATVANQLNIKFVDIGPDFTMQSLVANLDSTRRTVCIAGSLDEAFGNRLTQALAGLNRTYPIRVIGMPTWDNFNFSRAGDLEVIYTSPFFYTPGIPFENALSTEFMNHMSARPTDLFFRGYETTMRFALLLLDTNRDVASSLTRKGNTIITQFDIQPVFKDKNSMTLDYFENKHLYFIKVFGGVKNIIQ
jgi:ABC-type branched-subunit amino acid transport system substrate-binding protein